MKNLGLDEVVQVRVPHYPTYESVRAVLPSLVGEKRDSVTSLKSSIFSQRGTTKSNVDWSNPDEWIEEKLDGDHQRLASKIWKNTKGVVNPRHLTGAWLLATHYALLVDGKTGKIELSSKGQCFQKNKLGATTKEIDRLEGLGKILALVVEQGIASKGDLLPAFLQYLHQFSNVRADSTAKSYLWARLRNLSQRDLIERTGNSYKSTPLGREYLSNLGGTDSDETTQQIEIHRLIAEHHQSIRVEIRNLLMAMNPFQFEELIKSLLETIGYEDVEVTSPTYDGGVDVIGRIQLGISTVREVVQVKRYSKNIQRKVLDALRGSLHRFSAVRGTIITTSDFSKGTKAAAFESGAAPITLVNGERLIDLMIENKIGVGKKSFDLLEVNHGLFKEFSQTTDEN